MLTKIIANSFMVSLLILFYFSANSQGIHITSGANVVSNGASSIIVNGGSFINDGTFSAGSGSVILTGPNAATIGGSGTISFYSLGINKTAGVKLLQNIAVSGNVALTSNNIDLNGFNIDLGSNGSLLGENTNSYITSSSNGFVLKTANLNNPSALNPGNIGVEFTSAENFGSTLIKRGHQQQVSTSGHSINRFFDFVPTNNSGLNTTLKFYYLDAELASINEGELKQWASADNGTIWVLLGADAQDATLNYVTKNNINILNRLTLASSINSPLPIKLLSFTGQLVNSDVLLKWITTSEINANHFDVQRSLDANSFVSIGKINATNTNARQLYSFTDDEDYSGVRYYRLRMVDKDGSFIYSNVITINKGTYLNSLQSVYPNPTHSVISIEFTSNSFMKGTLMINDVDGRTIFSKEIGVQKGLNKLQYDLGKIAQGTYLIKIQGVDNKTIKVIKY